MKKTVWAFIVTFVFLYCALIHRDGYAASNITVAIIPFDIVAKQPNPQMKTQIPSMIAEKLEAEGARIIFIDEPQDPGSLDFSQFRKLGIQSGADYILTGSVFVAGQGISIDARLIDIFEHDKSSRIYADADSLENLYSAVSKLSKESLGAIYQRKIITDISITGNKRVEQDAILRLIDTQPGDILRLEKVSKDLKSIYDMGYFDDVIVEKETLDQGIKLVFTVKEKSTVRIVKFKNNLVYDEEELSDVISTRTGSILNIHKLNTDMERLRLLYTEKNYHNCTVTYEITPLKNNSQADIIFTIDEEARVKVEEISFIGNQHFSDKKIKKAISTSEKGFLSFLTGSGILNETEVNNDVIRIESLYKNNGFIDTKVSDPIISIGKDRITIKFEIEEGNQYTIKTIAIDGDLIIPKEQLLEAINSKEDELYNRENIRKDILLISDVYANKGFANVNVVPVTDKNPDQTMSITYAIHKGDPVYFNRINISGNSKTRDKVIRREIRVMEQDLYSKERIKYSFKSLNRLDYFEQVDVRPVKTEDKNIMNLDVNVVEKETGAFSVGGGFSSQDGGFVTGSVEERNLFGKGQTLKFEAKFATESVLYNVSFFEPYIMDTRISGGFRLYKEEKEYDHYDKDATGASVNVGYRLFDYTTVGTYYMIEDYEITNVETASTNMTPGDYLTSSIKPFITYDSRDHRFMPTEGGLHKFSIEYAGEFLGGDIDYTKYLAETTVFHPLFWKFTGALHAEGGYLDDRSGNDIDIDYVRFYLGGMKSVRGFDKYDIDGRREGDTKDIGGEKYLQFNAELTFPLTEKYKIQGVFFYDRGDVYRTSESIDLGDMYSSFGTGVRWDSPVGPLRVEYAWVIDGKTVKDTGSSQLEFSVGASF